MRRARKLLRIVFGRTMFVLVFFLIQLGFLILGMRWLAEYLTYFYGVNLLFGAAVVIWILNEESNPSFKMAWIVPVLVFPVFGCLFYIFVQLQIGTKLLALRQRQVEEATAFCQEQDAGVETRAKEESMALYRLSSYIKRVGGCPLYENSSVQYFPLGEDKFAALLRELEQARHFIFMEYFIVEQGYMWDSILEILERKAKAGVEVRMMYDGTCSLVLLPYHYPKQLEKKGIRCKMFAPVKPALSTYQNNRDHRKIAVIDGHTAFTGGINLADEYINKKQRFGHWKDTAVMIKGEAVRSFTMLFLQMWNLAERHIEPEETLKSYLCRDFPKPKKMEGLREGGFVLPYGDSPMDKENVGESVYMDILYQAEHYVHIMTPYLILDNEMQLALTYAAKRGVEVVILMPHIPDKLYAYLLARSYYEELLRCGVQIYEYTPGFVHAKMFVSDDCKAVVGTINLDYRSLYLHYECAVYLYKNPAVADIESDFQTTLQQSQPISLQACRKYSPLRQFAGRALRLLAPLM
ncbi:MAG: cardiolipin synthase [bacterium]|nr:cardiolipin synthase [bacterium]